MQAGAAKGFLRYITLVLIKVKQYECLENFSSVTPSKCLIGQKSNCALCQCSPVLYTNNVKHLGINFQIDMTWNLQLSNLSKTLRSVSCLLYNRKMFLPLSTRRLIVHSLAYSVLSYGLTVFVNFPE